jgi:hypothetical protein
VYGDKLIINHHVSTVVLGIFKLGKFVQFVIIIDSIFSASTSKSNGVSSDVIKLGTGTI